MSTGLTLVLSSANIVVFSHLARVLGVHTVTITDVYTVLLGMLSTVTMSQKIELVGGLCPVTPRKARFAVGEKICVHARLIQRAGRDLTGITLAWLAPAN